MRNEEETKRAVKLKMLVRIICHRGLEVTAIFGQLFAFGRKC